MNHKLLRSVGMLFCVVDSNRDLSEVLKQFSAVQNSVQFMEQAKMNNQITFRVI